MCYHYSRALAQLDMIQEKRDMWRCCQWYVTDGKDNEPVYVHKRDADNGFCLIRDLFTRCEEYPCSEFVFDNENEKEL